MIIEFNTRKIKALEDRIKQLESEQNDFLIFASKTMNNVMNQSKKKFMYMIQQEDFELIKDGKKIRKVRKIIS